MSVAGKRIVVGVSGGIAAYKAVELIRNLVDAGAHVIPVMTEDAHRFIGEVTLSALASEPVHKSLWTDASPIPHTRLGQTADLIVVAPATARVLSRLCNWIIRRPSHRHIDRNSRTGCCMSCDAHRDVGTPGSATQHFSVALARSRNC